MSFRLKNTEAYLISFVNKLKRLSIQELNEPRQRSYSSGRTINEPLNSSGNLAQSFIVKNKVNINSFNVRMIGNSYGEQVDEGTKVGTNVSVPEIINWINKKPVKLIDANQNTLKNITNNTKNRIANQIAQKIKREGIKPTNFLTNLINEQFEKLVGIENVVLKDINLDVDEFMKSIGYIKQGQIYKFKQ